MYSEFLINLRLLRHGHPTLQRRAWRAKLRSYSFTSPYRCTNGKYKFCCDGPNNAKGVKWQIETLTVRWTMSRT